MNAEFIEALEALERERGLSKDVLIEAIQTALITAFKRNFGAQQNVRVEIDGETGQVQVFSLQTVVDEVEDESTEISVADAKAIDPRYEVDDVVETEVTPKSFGRIAAQTAKQVVVQRIREAERNVIFEQYIEKENEVLSAVIQRVEKRNVFLELGRTEGLLPAQEHMPGEEYNAGDRIKVYVLEVKNTPKGAQVLVSRTHPGLVKRLFELEVPEIKSGVVQIKSIAREAGYRTKIAVYSSDQNIDPVGACVGQRGTRVERVVEELKGEKIDIIEWSQDPVQYIANALSPARVMMVQVNEAEHAARVVVPDNQLSLSIGKEGQNARLAAKLTGWKIDIKSQSQVTEMMAAQDEASDEALQEDE